VSAAFGSAASHRMSHSISAVSEATSRAAGPSSFDLAD
jgi:hypothetical protein